MFKQVSLPAMLLAMFLVSSPLGAAEVRREVLHGVYVPNCICKRCCDDYCAKPLPPVCCVKATCCDDYCAKPLPCPGCVKRFCCDDYCAKKPPCIICPSTKGLKCPPAPCR
jgi:hypothetical protein